METVLHGLSGSICYVYLDDVVVFGSNEGEHYDNLQSFPNSTD